MVRTAKRKQPARYSEIEQALRADIESGTYPIGECIPTEHALCARFSASRFTVRQALARLRDQGFVEARAGIGTIVIATRKREAFVQTLNSTEELLQYPADTWRKQFDTARIKATPEVSVMLRCSPGQDWVKLRAMRVVRQTDLPISWLELYVAPRFADVLDLPNPAGQPALKQIELHHGHRAAHAQVEIFVSRIGEDLAGPLRSEPGAPAMVILRRYRGSDGEVYLVTYSVHPENRFSLNFEFERQ